MAILSALLTALSRKIGDFISALVGWSVGALFGQMSARHRIFVSVALILSVFWPLFILGAFFPSVASAVIAFIPLDSPVVRAVMRVVWIALAVAAPAIVGLLIRAVSASARQRSALVTMLNGYPLALGFAISFLITLVTVPAVKVVTVARRWKDEHLYVQPRKGHYDLSIKALCEACVWAGLTPSVFAVPKRMALSTQVIRKFSRGAITDLVVENPKQIKCDGLELYLYPADLLLRGEAAKISRVRAMLGKTELEHHALLVKSERGQKLQNQLADLEATLARHPSPEQPEGTLKTRLKEIAEDLGKPGLTWDEWVTLDGIARRLENTILQKDSVIDRAGASRAVAAAKREIAHKEADARVQKALDDVHHASLISLVDAGVYEAKQLIQAEVKMAKVEARRELTRAVSALTAFMVALGCILTTFVLLLVAAILGFGGRPVHALVAAGIVFVAAVAVGVFGYGRLPLEPMHRTREHLELDVNQLREHLA